MKTDGAAYYACLQNGSNQLLKLSLADDTTTDKNSKHFR